MRSRLPAILPAVLVLASTFSSAAVQNRIGTVRSGARAPIANTIPRRARIASDLGEVPADRRLDSLTLTFSMTAAQQAALTQLLIDQQDPASPRYHQWLTPAQFGTQFGLSSADLAQVTSWLTAQGFTITSTAASANSITFSGTVAQAQAAFGATLHNISVDGEAHISNLSDPALPAAIAAVVTHISGLNDFKPKARSHPHQVKPQAADTTGLHPNFTSSISGNHYIAPGDFYTIYNVRPLLTSSITGQGITIAVAGQTDILNSDVTAFRTASGLCTVVSSTCPNPLPTVHLIGNDPGVRTSSGDLEEASLDVEWAGAVAPNANILYVNSGTLNGVFDSLIYAITANAAPIISISYGDCEANFGGSTLAAFNQYFQQANAQGQTIVGPSGDAGATDCDYYSYPAVGGLAVDFPASSPFVTSLGGTMFNEGVATGSTSYWNSNNNGASNNGGSALGYIPETVWNESSASAGLSAGGGGASAFFTKPYWQAGTPADFARDVPDISLNAASNHDATLYCTNGSCIGGGFYGSSGFLSTVGGTSVSTPTFAAILALVEQKLGTRVGNIGPVLYALANSTYRANVFNDVTAAGGNNNSACQAGTPNCPTGSPIGFNDGVGYDLATGWGSVNAFNLATYWNQVTPISSAGSGGQSISFTTATTTSPVCGVASAPLNVAVHVTSTVTNNTPAGTIQILIDGNAPNTPITGTLSGGSVTLSVSTAGLTSGAHTITAVYSGDSVNAGSKGHITTDVVSTTTPDFSFTPCSPTASALPGASTPATVFTVAPINGFTGTVTFSASSTDSVSATYVFTPTTVSITSANSATTSFVLNAFAASAVTGAGQVRLQRASNQVPPRAPWSSVPYAAGSGMALASAFLLILPRRRRWSALLAVMLSVGILGSAIGCTSSSSTPATGGTGSTGTTGTTNAALGTYTILVTAQATTNTGTITHSSTVSFVVHN